MLEIMSKYPAIFLNFMANLDGSIFSFLYIPYLKSKFKNKTEVETPNE